MRRHLWRAAGLVLAATAAGPALAQALPGSPTIMALPDPVATEKVALPAPRPAVSGGAPAPAAEPAPAAAACDASCGTARGRWFWPSRQAHAAKMQAKMWGYPEEFGAPPLGGTIHQHFRTMVANGEAARMVLYHYDFLGGRDALNLRGRDQLAKIAAMLGHNSFPIIIERTPENPALAEARRLAVLNVLAHNAIPVGPDRVVIGPAIATGMSGVEAELINQYFLFNLTSQATPLPPTSITTTGGFGGGFGQGGGGFGGGFGGGGFGGGGTAGGGGFR
jgi:uncharacterized membrane protein YgcG